MLIFARRLAAIAAVLSLCVGNVSVCAGWQSNPEARMACCTSATSCPMHKTAARASGSKHVVSQVQADSCCAAASTRTQSSAADPAFVVSNTTALPASAGLVVPVFVPALHNWRALVPLAAAPVPKHLLLSVLLV